MIKPGASTMAIADMILKVSAEFEVNPIMGVCSHDIQRFVLDGTKVILPKGDPQSQTPDALIEANDVFVLDIVMTSGEGQPKELEGYTTIFMNNPETKYELQSQNAKTLLADIQAQHPHFPFSLRSFTKEQMATVHMGMQEVLTNQLVSPYAVLCELDGETVCHLKCTLLVLPNGALKVTGVPLDMELVKSDKTVKDEVLKKLLATAGKKKHYKKKKGAAATSAAAV
jgi:methionine aminopeptidase